MTGPDGQPAAPRPIEPLDVDGVAVIAVGVLLWAVALVVLAITGVRFSSDNGWWLWTCIAGMGVGSLMLIYARRRRAAYRAAEAGTTTP